jgi:hypothetical protein
MGRLAGALSRGDGVIHPLPSARPLCEAAADPKNEGRPGERRGTGGREWTGPPRPALSMRPLTNASLYRIEHPGADRCSENKDSADFRTLAFANWDAGLGVETMGRRMSSAGRSRLAGPAASGTHIDIKYAAVVDCGWLSEIWNLPSCQGVFYCSAAPSHWSRACLNRGRVGCVRTSMLEDPRFRCAGFATTGSWAMADACTSQTFHPYPRNRANPRWSITGCRGCRPDDQ